MNHPTNKHSFSNTELVKQLKEKEEAIRSLQSENDTLRNIIALIPGNVFWKDNEGKFLGCNNNVAQILGLSSPNDIIGKSNSDLFDAQLAALADQVDKEANFFSEEGYVEEKGININHEQVVYLTKKMPLFNKENKIIGMMGVSFDITARKKMEEDLKIAKEKAEASSQAKSRFLAVATHELRTPLAAIIGLTNFLKQDHLPPNEEKEIIQSIENSANYLLNLVSEVLNFSRLESSKYRLNLSFIDLNALIEEIHQMLKVLAKNKNLELRVDTTSEITQPILTDARILRQILINLVGNAIKFTEKGHVTIQTCVKKQSTNKILLEIKVMDTGYGIPKNKLDIIFEPFEQLEDAYTRKASGSGTGLGLTIVKKLATAIGTHIQVVSQPKKGSIFSLVGEFEIQHNKKLKLKKHSVPPNSVPAKKKIQKTILSDTKKPLVLLVEDDPTIQYIHKKMLLELGCQVEVVSRGQEAIATLKNHDIAFVDVSLPDISGFEVIKSIRKHSHCPHIPIVALTVYTSQKEKAACLRAGANAFSSKPISKTHLQALLSQYIK